MITRLTYPKFKAFDVTGVPLSGGRLYTYEVGTTTPKVTYADELGTVPLSNPIILDSLGELTVFLIDPTKLVLKTSVDALLWTEESVGELTPEPEPEPEPDPTVLLADTVEAMQLLSAATGDVCFVKDLDRGGSFIYDSTVAVDDNQGTNFNGWVRQYSGEAISAEWFGARFDGGDDTIALQRAFQAGFRYTNLNPSKNNFLGLNKTQVPTDNSIFGDIKGVSLLGDSISQGAFALNSFCHLWSRLFQRMLNVDLLSTSYGNIPLTTLGSGITSTTDIHTVTFSGSWGTGVNANLTLGGLSLSNSNVGDEITISIPSFQNNGVVNYVQSTSGGSFQVTINAGAPYVVDSNGVLDPFKYLSIPVTDNGKGTCSIKIKALSGVVEITDISYYNGIQARMNLFAISGRKLLNVSNNVISKICANSSTVVMALGHNDTYSAEFASKIDNLIMGCNANNILLVIPDFRWNLGIDDRVRQELYRLHKGVQGSIYIPFPELFKNTGETVPTTYQVDLGLWQDSSHPNINGHKLIAETMAKEMKLSVTSKAEALDVHNYPLPVALNTGTSVVNVATISKVRWNKTSILLNFFVQVTPSGAFPVGTHILQTAWNPKFEVPVISQSVTAVAYVKVDGAIVSVVTVSGGGTITLYVLSAYITNQSFEVILIRS